MVKFVFVGLILLVGTGLAWAADPLQLSLNLGLEADGSSGPSVSGGSPVPGFSTKETVGIAGKSSLFDAQAQLYVSGDGKYGSDIANFRDTKSFFKNYFFLEKGFLDLHLTPFDIQGGRFAQYDAFSSPYSLFLNSQGHSALGLRVHYEDSWFVYETRWIQLTANSDFGTVANTPAAWQQTWDGTKYVQTGTGFPDRGASFHNYIFKFGDALRVGLQDAAVYSQRSFDPEYFISPAPGYFTQYFRTTAGRPWTTSGNDNYLMGLFTTYQQPAYDLGFQVLIDDFSLHFLLPDQVPNNPWKAAWTLGGRFRTDLGWFGFYHAGALKYTFEPITTGPGGDSQSAYGFTSIPDVEYSTGDGSFLSMDIADNAVGYLYGENNAAFRLTWDNTFGRDWKVATNVEFLLAGNNSPANPWQDATGSNEVGTHWLDDPVLQKSVVWTTQVRWAFGDWSAYANGSLGFVWNILGLASADGSTATPSQGWSAVDNYAKIFKPTADSAALVRVAVGVSGPLDVSAFQRWAVGRR
jgi:hypothetical protein